ncbi:hypothetical protein [Metabacillus sp. FJAT-53654]|uniref:Uncharacterized protein n=1 Tax=Metabacillus rhizosphaerae TaxID=3117747 RepID=A0ABZ2MSE9_9BACI
MIISKKFIKDKVLEVISNIPFLEFLKEVAGVGIVTYRVCIPESKVTYIGVGEEEIEGKI